MVRVLLFDIDGTLIHSGGAGLATLYEVFESEFGIPASTDVRVHGRTDRSIARDFFVNHQLADNDDNFARLRDAYQDRLAANMASYAGRVLPGVVDLLEAITRNGNAAIGLLTGNTPMGACIKLSHFGLERYFAFGGYGEFHYDRDDVAREALSAARQFTANSFDHASVCVIGDTPADVRCARAINAVAVAVETGGFSRESLAAADPDYLLDDLTDAYEVIMGDAGL